MLQPPEDDNQVANQGNHAEDPDARAEKTVGHEVFARAELIRRRIADDVGLLDEKTTEAKFIRAQLLKRTERMEQCGTHHLQLIVRQVEIQQRMQPGKGADFETLESIVGKVPGKEAKD